ncbi:MAG: hypothetical protein IPM63_09325 [Acidobacteriota bacterium]|nr:MAG: hypothetical protein IPM63_09325 [Acidobacteriota bacterium]
MIGFDRSLLIPLLLLLGGLALPIEAQQTVFNVPSSDVLGKGELYFELDAAFKTNDQETVGRFSSFVPRIVFGTGNDIEVGLNVTGNVQPGEDATTLVPAVKWRAYSSEANGLSVVVGTSLHLPVRDSEYDVGNYSYAQASKTFKTGTRVTAGGYYFSESVVAPDAQRAGAQFAFEQRVTSYLNVNADWITGKHSAGYFTPGVAFKLHPRVTGYAAYSIGNADAAQGNHFFYAAIGINLR